MGSFFLSYGKKRRGGGGVEKRREGGGGGVPAPSHRMEIWAPPRVITSGKIALLGEILNIWITCWHRTMQWIHAQLFSRSRLSASTTHIAYYILTMLRRRGEATLVLLCQINMMFSAALFGCRGSSPARLASLLRSGGGGGCGWGLGLGGHKWARGKILCRSSVSWWKERTFRCFGNKSKWQPR